MVHQDVVNVLFKNGKSSQVGGEGHMIHYCKCLWVLVCILVIIQWEPHRSYLFQHLQGVFVWESYLPHLFVLVNFRRNVWESEWMTRIYIYSSSSIAHFLLQWRNKGAIENTSLRLARYLHKVSSMTPYNYSVSLISPSEF